jgi:hypothetical protein
MSTDQHLRRREGPRATGSVPIFELLRRPSSPLVICPPSEPSLPISLRVRPGIPPGNLPRPCQARPGPPPASPHMLPLRRVDIPRRAHPNPREKPVPVVLLPIVPVGLENVLVDFGRQEGLNWHSDGEEDARHASNRLGGGAAAHLRSCSCYRCSLLLRRFNSLGVGCDNHLRAASTPLAKTVNPPPQRGAHVHEFITIL